MSSLAESFGQSIAIADERGNYTSTITFSAKNGIEASGSNPCPLCNSDRWCFHLSEDAAICGKTDSPSSGWFKVGTAKDGRSIFAREGSRRHRHRDLPNPEEILPLTLNPKTDSPQWVTLSTVGTESEQQIEYPYPNPETGEPLGKVIRKQWTDRRAVYGSNGRETKEIRPSHWAKPAHPDMGDGWWSDRGKGLEKWSLYREAEVRDAIASGAADVVFYVAGEQAVETARQLGLTAFCNQGGEGSYIQEIVDFLSANKPKLFAVWRDNDNAGAKASNKLLKACASSAIPCVVLEPENIWLDLPQKGDIYNVVTESGMEQPEIIKRLEIEIHRAILQRQNELDHAKQKGKKPPKPAAIARELAEKYRQQLAWHTGVKLWYRYSAKTEGIWSDLPDEAVNAIVIAALESRPDIAGDYSFPFVSHTASLMKAYLQVHEWNETPGLIPLQDGVLELATGKLLPHAPGYRLLWCLPYAWKDRAIGCQPIQDWMLAAMKGDRVLVEVLRAYLNAVVTGRVDLHRYLECIGPGGTGKGTYMRAAMALIGAENTAVTTLEQLEKNRFETSSIFGKRLLLITDSERYGGEVSVLKAITGGDPVRYERKNVQQCKPYIPNCMVIVGANEAVQSGDYTSGLERRRLSIPFIHQVKAAERRDLNAEFKPYLPGLLAWVLEMPNEQVTDLLRDTSNAVHSLARWKAETLIETNPMADWLDGCIVVNPAAKTYVGVAKRDKDKDSSNSYIYIDRWLYANYCEYSAATGSKPVSVRRFSPLLNDLCVNQLKLAGVSKGRDNQGAYFQGLMIRNPDFHNGWSRPITGDDDPPNKPPGGGGGSPNPSPPPSGDGLVMDSDVLVTAETLISDGSDGSDGIFQNNSQIEKESETLTQKTNSIEPGVGIEASNPSPQPATDNQQGFQPSQVSSPIHHQSVTNHHSAPQGDAAKEDVTVPSPQQLAALILGCKTWVAVVEQIDAVSAATNKARDVVFEILMKMYLSEGDRQHLVSLLAAHVRLFPQDKNAYAWLPGSCWKLKKKAISLAYKNEAGVQLR